MSDQEILDAIDAEIALTRNLSRRVKLNTPGAAETLLANICYVNGLYFARALIVKRMEGGK